MRKGLVKSEGAINGILRVASSNLLKLAAGVLVGFLLPKIIGVKDYGYYKTFTLYATYAGLFHFGFADGIYLKFGGKSYEELERSSFITYSKFLILAEAIIAFVGAIIGMLTMKGDVLFIFLCLVLYLLTFNVTNYYQIISQITGRFKELSSRNSIYSALTALSIFFLWLVYQIREEYLSYRIYTCMYVVVSLILCVWYIHTYREITFGESDRLNRNEVWGLMRLGFPLMIANLSSSLLMSLDRQFVNVLFNAEIYAIYAFAYNMLSLITTAISAISTVLYPTLKRTDGDNLKKSYLTLLHSVTVIVFACIAVYFPLCKFVTWFLPKYTDSLAVFRVILPGLSISSAITIVMHNYYKVLGKSGQYFVKSIFVLALSALANYCVYKVFGTPISISIASIVVMIIWYFIVENGLRKVYKTNFLKNVVYIALMSASFYLITLITQWYVGLLAYFAVWGLISFVFFREMLFRKRS